MAPEARAQAVRQRALEPERCSRVPEVFQIRAVGEDRLGFLWVSSERGLWRFDGRQIRPMSPPGQGAVTAFDFDAAGDPWFVARQELHSQVVRLRGGVAEPRAALTKAAGDEIGGLVIDAADRAWAMSPRGLFMEEQGTVRRIAPEDGLPAGPVHHLNKVKGELWVATDRGIFRFAGPHFVPVLTDDDVVRFGVDRAGRIWSLSARQGGRLRLWEGPDGDPHVTAERAFSGPVEGVTFPADPRQRGVFLATPAGLWFWDGSNLERWLFTGVPPEMDLKTVHTDRHGNLWVGANFEGLLRIRPQALARTFPNPPGTDGRDPGAAAFAVAIDQQGIVWASTRSGLHERRGDSSVTHIIPPAWQVFSARSLSVAPDDAIFVSTISEGLLRFSRGRWEHFTMRNGFPSDSIWSLFHDRRGTLWLGVTGGGLIRADFSGPEARFTVIPGFAAACPATPVAFAEARDGLWVATSGAGLCRLRGDVIDRFTVRDGLHEDDLRSLFLDQDDTLFVGANRLGLAVWRAGRFTKLPLDQGLNLEEISSIIADRQGFLWLSTPVGLFRLAREDIRGVLAGRRKSVRGLNLSVEDGLPSGTFIASWPSSAVLAPDGGLWFPNLRGLVQVARPEAVVMGDLPAPAIEDVRINGAPLPDSRAPTAVKKLPRFPRGNGTIEARFAASELEHPHGLRYWHRLNGIDSSWKVTDAGRSVVYANLPAGRYELVVAVGSNLRDERRFSSFAFVLVPPFYRTWIFFLLCLAGLVLGLYFAYRLRVWQLRDRFAAVMNDRARIARDMHDTIEQDLIAMKLHTESLVKNPAQTTEVRDYATTMAGLITRGLNDAKSSIWALRAESAQSDLATALSVVAGLVLRGSEVKFELALTGPPIRLEPEVQQQIVRIIQEGFNNALKHAAPGTISLALDFSGPDVQIAFADDGRGFDSAHAEGPAGGHFGLRGMAERAEQIGARLSIEGRPGAGTRVTITVPGKFRRPAPSADLV